MLSKKKQETAVEDEHAFLNRTNSINLYTRVQIINCIQFKTVLDAIEMGRDELGKFAGLNPSK